MKLLMNIIECSENGETLKIKAQGKAAGAQEWHPYRVINLELPSTQKTLKTYHLGRNISVTVKAK